MSAKEILVKNIPAKIATEFVKKHHYSHKVVTNSQIHFGVFLHGGLHGVLSFGPSINKKGTMSLVSGTKWNEFIELNRMVFDDVLPRNSESRAISVVMKMFRKNAPHIKWVTSFADATQCGTGTIYRASGFVLVNIKKNTSLLINPHTGKPIHQIQAHHMKIAKEARAWKPLEGYQIQYLYFLDKSCKKYLTVKPIDFTELDKLTYPEGVRHKTARQ